MSENGRPRALADDQKRRMVCAMVALGAGVEAAARHVGCSAWTVRREASRDEEFARQLQEAHMSAELIPLRLVRRAAETHWRAAAWLLERTCPERFAHRRPDAVAPDEIAAVLARAADILVDECVDEPQRERVVERLRQLQEDQFGERRARAQGPPRPRPRIDRMLERSYSELAAWDFCSPSATFAGKTP